MVLTKQQMCCALLAAAIDIPNTATLSQIRQLYDENIRQQVDEIIHQPSNVSSVAVVNDVPLISALVQNDVNDQEAVCGDAPIVIDAALVDADAVPAALPVPVPVDELDAELVVLQKRRQIALLRAELNTLCGNNDEPLRRPPIRRIDFADIQCTITPFNGDDGYVIIKWLEDFNLIMDSFEADEHSRLLFARRLLSGSANMMLQTVVVKTWRELQDALMNEFDRPIARKDIYKQLSDRFIRVGEPIRQYVLAMQQLANRADVDESELVHFIIDGLRDSSPAITMLYGSTDLTTLKNRLSEYERYRARSLTPLPAGINRPTTSVVHRPATNQPNVSSAE